MTVIAAVLFFPLVLLYQGWSFHVFRARLKSPAAPGPDSGSSAATATSPPSPSPPATPATGPA